MIKKKIYDRASTVKSLAGSVAVDGPDGINLEMTPEAAAETGGRMLEKAAETFGKKALNADARKRDLTPPYVD